MAPRLRFLTYLSPSIPREFFERVVRHVEARTGLEASLDCETAESGPSRETDPFAAGRADLAFVAPRHPLLRQRARPAVGRRRLGGSRAPAAGRLLRGLSSRPDPPSGFQIFAARVDLQRPLLALRLYSMLARWRRLAGGPIPPVFRYVRVRSRPGIVAAVAGGAPTLPPRLERPRPGCEGGRV